MLKLTGDEVVCIHNSWHGNGGDKSLHDLVVETGHDVNTLYSVLSATHKKSSFTAKERTGMKVHAYDPKYGTRGRKK